jgi:hypothetical protein
MLLWVEDPSGGVVTLLIDVMVRLLLLRRCRFHRPSSGVALTISTAAVK